MTSPHAIFATIAVAVGCFIFIGIYIASSRARERRRHAIRTLADDGWQVHDRPRGDERRTLFEPFAHARALARKDKGVRACLRRNDTTVLEYVYTESSGSSSHTVRLLACAVACPPDWPELTLTREHALHRLSAILGIRDIEVEDPAFNDRWRVRSPDETFAILFLTPEVQRFLMDDDAPESWWIANGSLVCVRRGRLEPEQVAHIEQRTRTLRATVPPELDVYAPEDA